MEYSFNLTEEEAMSLIEMIEQHRCEGEEQKCSDLRTSIKSQFQAQFKSHEEQVNLEVDDLLSAAKKTLGPGYCDNCD
jgi:hypothetical protein|tara:strand:- start:503 stop:736 length:234 start_codon:yes stop_codon:yes gene_type:complete